ncbi:MULTISPECIES: succinate dehydrogenase, hydrophobic membrane anchor protein [Halocynthiibacter]|uniref:Succinate dehydrogenase hydrophobic membrane anchor subunit n=1 Tax=Halocynthiibacter halioticoli TaxID=2986804 RepID=A0AAE3LQJ7_9RHOB|nr:MULTISPECIES: succinate dehydrogenase, hydrophobic membrane anchor protein [Halocynthiibacter]MCV6823603.1 succinate dehydrogenase, hydrophobic membrane anchor protein [Halocynthiibacter halioticoli]MCW4056604.1 succinate dehydrogenase, hydrophobic membrane anchor protein [Halocynthiibacter sp. SDUM655004]MDE0590379.1 succinate dehydrogenase, hydrophobic membrane anchor protein [Halocynthiibacter sp. C4]
MRYITDRKRAEGRGASGTGTYDHWYMQVSAVGLAVLTPFFVYIFGSALGGTYEEVIATFSRPIPAIITGLMLVFGLQHFRKGAQMMIEDYLRGFAKKFWIVTVILFSYGVMAAGLFSLAKIAL